MPMRLPLLALLVLFSVVGCSKKEASSGRYDFYSASADKAGAQKIMPLEAKIIEEAQPGSPMQRALAYHHQIEVEVDEARVASLFESAQALCRQATAEACELLDSRISTGRNPYATLKFRAKPAGIQKIVASLGKDGDIKEQSTTAEDLAGPIADVNKQLAMRQAYRAKLEELLARKGLSADELISLNKELAEVQSDLEAASGQRAQLVRRVETELLDVSIQTAGGKAFWRPIGNAFADFGGHLAQGIAVTITAIAYLLPWLLPLFVLIWVVRKLWRRRRPVVQ